MQRRGMTYCRSQIGTFQSLCHFWSLAIRHFVCLVQFCFVNTKSTWVYLTLTACLQAFGNDVWDVSFPTDCLCWQTIKQKQISKHFTVNLPSEVYMRIIQKAIWIQKNNSFRLSMKRLTLILRSPVVPSSHRQTLYLPLSVGILSSWKHTHTHTHFSCISHFKGV